MSLGILSRLAVEEGDAQSDWSSILVSELAPLLPPSLERAGNFVGPNVAGPGLRWHADQLVALCEAQADMPSPVERARRRYHARMLGYGLALHQAEFHPLVTVLLPVYNRVGPLVEAVQSCIDQTWRPIEILVVDDGSTEDVRSALRPFGDQVRLIHKPNGGVASARNFGLRAAQGDFIHFLDSDDLLLPSAIENAVAAFAAVADADLCYGQGQWIDMRTTPPQMKTLRVREHSNPTRSMIVAFAFTVPTVMIPRWRMLAMPPFEEDLRRSSDWRYWQRLGFAQAKVVGHRALTAHLRRFQNSLQATPHPEDDSHPVAVLRGLRDLLQHPHAWPYAAEYMNLLTATPIQRWFAIRPSARIAAASSEVAAALQCGFVARGKDDLSLLPVLATLNGRIARLRRHGHWPDEDAGSTYRFLAKSIARAIDSAAPVSDRDVAFWTESSEAAAGCRPLQRFFDAIRRRCPRSSAAAMACAVLRTARKVPRPRSVRLAARLQPILGTRLAGAAAVRWMRWRGG